MRELEEARDKVRWGRERRSLAMSDKEKKNTAYHEAGHAILVDVCSSTRDPLHKVTIIPRGPSLGSTMYLPEEDKYTHAQERTARSPRVTMGGRVAEEIDLRRCHQRRAAATSSRPPTSRARWSANGA